jgi:hypothetical protein
MKQHPLEGKYFRMDDWTDKDAFVNRLINWGVRKVRNEAFGERYMGVYNGRISHRNHLLNDAQLITIKQAKAIILEHQSEPIQEEIERTRKREFYTYLDELTRETGFDFHDVQKAMAYHAAKIHHEKLEKSK